MKNTNYYKKTMNKILTTIMVLMLTFVMSCKNGGDSANETKSPTTENGTSEESAMKSSEEDTASELVCLLDKLSIREEPSKKGKWITAMSLAEKVEFNGEKITDTVSKKEYYKVKLIDGKEGWARATFLANGKVAAIKEETSTYKRPTLETLTDEKYSPMDIVAVISTKDGWIQVKGKRAKGQYIEEAWIKPGNISEDPTDVATAKFASVAITKGSMTEKIKALEAIVNNKDLSGSSFIPAIEEKIEDYKAKNIPVTE